MPVTFQGGQVMPAQGTAAYNAAASNTGSGSYNPTTNSLTVTNNGNSQVFSPSNNFSAPIPTTTNSGGKVSTPVVTSELAQNDYNKKLDYYNNLLTSLEAHSNAKTAAADEAKARAAAQDLEKSKMNIEQQGLDIKKQEADTKAQALKMANEDQGNKPPQGWDAETYKNFKAANPNLEPTAEDTARMLNAGTNQGKVDNANLNIKSASEDNIKTQTDLLTQKEQIYTDFQKKVAQIMNGTFPLSSTEQALINSVQQSLDRQKSSLTGALSEELARTGQEYTPAQAAGMLANKVMDLDAAAAGTMASLRLGFQKQDYQMINDTYEKQIGFLNDKANTIQKLHDTVIQTEKDQRDQAQKVQDNINKVSEEAAKNGATPEQIAKINSSGSVSEAINNAGGLLHTATGDMGEYLFYKQQTEANGHTPVDFNTFLYNKEYTKERAKQMADSSISGSTSTTETPIGLGSDGKGGSILSQTGLSVSAFNFLTQGTAALSRMGAAQRNQIMNEAQKFLNKNGIDISTFQSQYKAYNDVLQKNIARANQTQIMAGEVTGSADSLINAIDEKDMGNIRAKNLVDLFLGKEINDETTQKYRTQLGFMMNDLAGYLAASRGASQPENRDIEDAANLIQNGMSKRSAEAFKSSIKSNEEKVTNVVNKAVENTRKQVWGLFGVGDKYKGGTSTVDQMTQDHKEAENKLTSSLNTTKSTNPTLWKAASSMYTSVDPSTGQPYTAEDILKAFPELSK